MKKSFNLIAIMLTVMSVSFMFGCEKDVEETANPLRQQAQIVVEFPSTDTADIYRVNIIVQSLDTIDSTFNETDSIVSYNTVLNNVDTIKYYDSADGNTIAIDVPANNPSVVTIGLIVGKALKSIMNFQTISGRIDSTTLVVEAAQPPLSSPSSVSTATNGLSVNLSWSSVDNAEGYYIYRATDTASSPSYLKKSWKTSSSDAADSYGTIYYYRITAYNIAGESAFSDWTRVEFVEVTR